MKFKIHVFGETNNCRIDFTAHTAVAQIVVQIRAWAKKNKLQCTLEVIDY